MRSGPHMSPGLVHGKDLWSEQSQTAVGRTHQVMTLRLRLRFYRLCNVVMELERMQPVIDAVQTLAEVGALLLL